MLSLSLVIPVYNEEKNIPILLSSIRDTIPQFCDDYEIIFIDDHSIDSTLQILGEAAFSDPRIRIIRNYKNRKLGGCLKQGYKAAGKERILYFDADMPFDLKDVEKALAVMAEENVDIVSAYRLNRQVDSIRSWVYSCVYNAMIRVWFGLRIKDVNFSCKLFKREVLERITPDSEGSFINAEVFIRAQEAGYKVAQFSTIYHPRVNGCSTLSSVSVVIQILREAFGFYRS